MSFYSLLLLITQCQKELGAVSLGEYPFPTYKQTTIKRLTSSPIYHGRHCSSIFFLMVYIVYWIVSITSTFCYFMCVDACLHVCLYVWRLWRPDEGTGSQKLELQVIVSRYVGVGNRTLVLRMSSALNCWTIVNRTSYLDTLASGSW